MPKKKSDLSVAVNFVCCGVFDDRAGSYKSVIKLGDIIVWDDGRFYETEAEAVQKSTGYLIGVVTRVLR